MSILLGFRFGIRIDGEFPHMHLPEDIAVLFQEACQESPHRGEDDLDASEELADPVPRNRAARKKKAISIGVDHRASDVEGLKRWG